MRVEVTQEDIDKGTRCSEEFCPIALAIKRKRGVRGVRVSGLRTSVVKGRFDLALYELPERVLGFLDAYDEGGEVVPCSFRMRRVN